MPELVRMRRELLGLTRKQLAALLGYKRATVKQYEWVRCTMPYWKATEALMKTHYPKP